MPKGDFAKKYWTYRKAGGSMSMQEFAVLHNDIKRKENETKPSNGGGSDATTAN